MADETIRVEALVIGAGPGGYVAGIRLGQLGKKAMVVERDRQLRRTGVRTRREIDEERYALKALRGDFSGLPPDAPRNRVTRVDAAFYRWTPVIEGLSCGPFRPPLGYDPGPVRVDVTITPHRPFLPLQYRTTITAT